MFVVPLPRYKLEIDLNRDGLAGQAQLLQQRGDCAGFGCLARLVVDYNLHGKHHFLFVCLAHRCRSDTAETTNIQ